MSGKGRMPNPPNRAGWSCTIPASSSFKDVASRAAAGPVQYRRPGDESDSTSVWMPFASIRSSRSPTSHRAIGKPISLVVIPKSASAAR